ncbi:hypothetical protein [Motiliproteus sp. MSK22-1]|uniref:hypothetical protein n=1 Tax=Motiliproteus sp. MSK22-1 TaxID=1897630 RepID=UPI0009789EA7|nr:hypothetical protein [Motiliproteus sp. MSK22-1]OMH38808.1 hypothetical protein BGP75_00035 [Motiliproteus sp. MSK22-1]
MSEKTEVLNAIEKKMNIPSDAALYWYQNKILQPLGMTAEQAVDAGLTQTVLEHIQRITEKGFS